jgi:hypothetical protein
LLTNFLELKYTNSSLSFSNSSQFAQDYIRKQPPTSKNNLVTTAWFYQADASIARRADAGEDVTDNLQSIENNEPDVSEEKIAALAEMICRAGDEPAMKSAALLVLMAALEHATHPKALANTAKQFVFTRCGELNFCGMIDAQVSVIESELLCA